MKTVKYQTKTGSIIICKVITEYKAKKNDPENLFPFH